MQMPWSKARRKPGRNPLEPLPLGKKPLPGGIPLSDIQPSSISIALGLPSVQAAPVCGPNGCSPQPSSGSCGCACDSDCPCS